MLETGDTCEIEESTSDFPPFLERPPDGLCPLLAAPTVVGGFNGGRSFSSSGTNNPEAEADKEDALGR